MRMPPTCCETTGELEALPSNSTIPRNMVNIEMEKIEPRQAKAKKALRKGMIYLLMMELSVGFEPTFSNPITATGFVDQPDYESISKVYFHEVL